MRLSAALVERVDAVFADVDRARHPDAIVILGNLWRVTGPGSRAHQIAEIPFGD